MGQYLMRKLKKVMMKPLRHFLAKPGSGKRVPRCIFLDLEPSVIDEGKK